MLAPTSTMLNARPSSAADPSRALPNRSNTVKLYVEYCETLHTVRLYTNTAHLIKY